MSVFVDEQAVVAALPSYEIGEELGRGAWGVVRAGRHRQLGREVAIKQLPPVDSSDHPVRTRFVAEARMLAGLDHPHIVPVYDYVERDGLCLLIMERLTGGTLWDRFAAGELELQESCAAVLATCAGLHHAHRRGTLHRDIKPQNLMFSADGVLKVTDFGMAKVVGGSLTVASRDGQVLGTPAYMAPEQASGENLGPETDVYATGTVLYELLSGRLPFPKDSKAITTLYRHVHEQPTALDEVAPWVPVPIGRVAMRAISTAPEDRYPSAEAFGVALATACVEAWGAGWLSRAGAKVSDSAIVAASSGESVKLDAPPEVPTGHPSLDSVPASGLVSITQLTKRQGRLAPVRPTPLRRHVRRAPRPQPLVAGLVAILLVLGAGGAFLLNRNRQAALVPLPAAPGTPSPEEVAPDVPAWRVLRDAPVARRDVATTALDGTLWVVGGLEPDGGTLRVERYDPAIDTWTAGPGLPIPLHHAMAVTYRGEIVVLGGWIPQGRDLKALTSQRVFALRSGAWVELPSLNVPRGAAAAAVVGDYIVVVGGTSNGELISETEVFDGQRWVEGESIPTPREHLAAASDGQYLYAVGGYDMATGESYGHLERYDPTIDSWDELPSMPTPRGGLGAAVAGGLLVAAGGEQPFSPASDGTVEAFDIAAGEWLRLPPLHTPRGGLSVAAVGNEVYAINGGALPFITSSTASVETLMVAAAPPPVSADWRRMRDSYTARQQVAVAASGGVIWVLGGLEGQHATPRVEGYDPLTDLWHAGVDLPIPLHHATAVNYRGQIVVIGGWVPDGTNLTGTASDKVWALRDGAWVEMPPLNRPRAAGAAAVVGDRIVVLGGQADGELIEQSEVFDGDNWVDVATIPSPRSHLAAVSDGQYVYAIGGRQLSSDRNSPALERYDPVADKWEILPPMPTPRGSLGATMLDGRIVAAGGEHPTGVFETVEVYDPRTGAWTRLPSLKVPRHGLGLATIGRVVYAVNGATRPTFGESSAAVEAFG